MFLRNEHTRIELFGTQITSTDLEKVSFKFQHQNVSKFRKRTAKEDSEKNWENISVSDRFHYTGKQLKSNQISPADYEITTIFCGRNCYNIQTWEYPLENWEFILRVTNCLAVQIIFLSAWAVYVFSSTAFACQKYNV